MTQLEEIERRMWCARWAVLRAGKLIADYFEQGVETELKEDETPVTVADREAEQLLRAAIAQEFPSDGFLGEEFGRQDGKSGFTWIIDPIDGTMNFVRKIPLVGTLVGLEFNGEIVAGICNIPLLGDIYHAVKGRGAFKNDKQIFCSKIETLKESQLVYPSVDRFETMGRLDVFLQTVRDSWRTRGLGDFYGFCLVAEGCAEAMLEPAGKAWDLAALKPIVEEAGGTFTDWSGTPSVYSGGALAANKPIHKILIDRFRI